MVRQKIGNWPEIVLYSERFLEILKDFEIFEMIQKRNVSKSALKYLKVLKIVIKGLTYLFL